MSINIFCDNILNLIFSYLSISQLLQIYITNKLLNQLKQEDIIYLYEEYSIKYCYDKKFNNLHKIMKLNYQFLIPNKKINWLKPDGKIDWLNIVKNIKCKNKTDIQMKKI
jgi:hypothetical protein